MSAFELARWIIAVALIALFVVVALANATALVRQYRCHKRESLVPFVGGVAGTLGIFVLPVVELRHFWWLPIVLDAGSFPIHAAVALKLLLPRTRFRHDATRVAKEMSSLFGAIDTPDVGRFREELATQLGKCQDPHRVQVELIELADRAQWPPWAIQAMPFYIPVDAKKGGLECAVVSQYVMSCIPDSHQVWVERTLCGGFFSSVCMQPRAAAFARFVSPVLERLGQEMPVKSHRAQIGLVIHALVEVELRLSGNPAVAAAIAATRARLLEKEGILTASEEIDVRAVARDIVPSTELVEPVLAGIREVIFADVERAPQADGAVVEFLAALVLMIVTMFGEGSPARVPAR